MGGCRSLLGKSLIHRHAGPALERSLFANLLWTRPKFRYDMACCRSVSMFYFSFRWEGIQGLLAVGGRHNR